MCVSPITIKVSDYMGNRTIKVPCGKCYECLKTKHNDYMVRIYEELMNCSKACFLTLTYSNDSIPYLVRDGKRFFTVWKQDIKDWIKRFRTNYERKTGLKGIRYFLCSEYGPKTCRPHYHAIFFGLSVEDMKMALDDWRSRFGFVMAKDVSCSIESFERSARYVSKYCCKGILEHPFRFSAPLISCISPLFKGSWPFLCESDALLPYFFISSKGLPILSYSRLSPPFKYKDFRLGLSGRGLKTKIG